MIKELYTVTTINGKFVKRGQDKISVFDNALLYAEGLFETLLVINGQIKFINEHFKRLREGSKVLGIKLPVTKKVLLEWMKKTALAHPDKVLKLRLTVTSGEAARWTGVQGGQQIIISASPHTIPDFPFKLNVSQHRVDEQSQFRRIKTTSYAIHAAALSRAKKLKCHDALMINEQGNVAEVSSANIFWVVKGRVYTTPLSSGCLDGITRKAVMTDLDKFGFKVKEKNIKLNELIKADEIFITSSLKIISPVGLIKNKQRSYKFETGRITKIIRDHYYRKFKVL